MTITPEDKDECVRLVLSYGAARTAALEASLRSDGVPYLDTMTPLWSSNAAREELLEFAVALATKAKEQP